MTARGDLTRVVSGIYVRAGYDIAETIRSNAHLIAGRLIPGSTITDRSAPTGGVIGGTLYLARDGRPRDIRLPGLTIRARKGAAPQPDDVPLPAGLFLASPARGLAENC